MKIGLIKEIKKVFIVVDPLDEIVFEDRNKDYGAYVVRKKYNQNVKKALIITLMGSLLFCLGSIAYEYFIKNYIEMNAVEVFPSYDIVNYLDNIQVQNFPKPSELPAGAVIPMQVVSEIPEVSDSNKIKENKTKQDQLTKISQDTSSLKSGFNGTSTSDSAYIVPYGVTEKNAEFPGGEASRLRYIRTNIQYPAEAVKAKISGKVIISFIINKQGYIENVVVVKSAHPLLDHEAVRVIKSMPRWTPAVKHGKTIYQIIKVPITFVPPPD
jgi:periplasmic protein TonB